MTALEDALCFGCRGATLIGILHRPETPPTRGIVIVVGGPQYRVGSHRQFVHLARVLAASGVAVLRFDHRGIGDSGGEFAGFEHIHDDIAAAVDALLRNCPTVKEVALWGLCDAASAILFYAPIDARIRGVALVNPWVRSEAGLARAHLKSYYPRRLFEQAFWRKLIRGGVDLREAVGAIIRALRVPRPGQAANALDDAEASLPPFVRRMHEGFQQFSGPVLLILSGNDLTAQEFIDLACSSKTWRRILEAERVRQFRLASADHTFASATWREAVAEETKAWLKGWR